MTRTKFRFVLLTLLSISMAGCQSLQIASDDSTSDERDWLGREKKIEYATPNKMVAIWTNSVFSGVDGSARRGLGGRFYFYDTEHHAIPVKGKLAVFLYDDTDSTDKKKREATKIVHFTAEQIVAGYSPTEFGPSYSLWVPWDENEDTRKQLSVIPVFTDESGKMLPGDQARHILPGMNDDAELISSKIEREISPIMQTNHSEEVADDEKIKIEATTIKLPPSMQRRLSRPAPRRIQRDLSRLNRSHHERLPKTSESLQSFRKPTVAASLGKAHTTAEAQDSTVPLRNIGEGQDLARAQRTATELMQRSADSQHRQSQAPSSQFFRQARDRGSSVRYR